MPVSLENVSQKLRCGVSKMWLGWRAMVECVPTVMATPLGSCDVCPPCFLSLFSMIICMFCTMFNSSPTPPSVMLRMFNIYSSIETQTPPPRAKVGICEKVLWYLNACLTRWYGGFLRICFCIFIEVEEQGGDLNQRRHRVGRLWDCLPQKFFKYCRSEMLLSSFSFFFYFSL